MALRNQPYIPLYVQDFLTDEKLIECSAEATGVYIRLMCIMHKSEQYGTILLKQKDKQTDKQIKNFAIKLAKHLPYELQLIERCLTELIDENVLIIEEDLLIQKRMVKDNLLSNTRAISGSKGGKKTMNKNKNFAQANIKANSEYENEYENEDVIINKNINIEFDIFWNLYDKKIGNKEKLINKWKKLKDIEREDIIKYIPKYKLSQPDKKFRKNPETFLNNKSWNDEIIADKQNNEPIRNRQLN